mmetsp:Transcript_40879/g.97452  ORF Transcript_40879/g.97452 Transcript_40879/m.97452 type:complete len:270 (-) Transcript_40879:352-1161(-)
MPTLLPARVPTHNPTLLPSVAHAGTESPKVSTAGGSPRAAPTRPPTAEPLAPPREPRARPPRSAEEAIRSVRAVCGLALSESSEFTPAVENFTRRPGALLEVAVRNVSGPRIRSSCDGPSTASIDRTSKDWQRSPPAVPKIMPLMLPMPALMGTERPNVRGAGMMPDSMPTTAPPAPPVSAPRPPTPRQRLPLDMAVSSIETWVAASDFRTLRWLKGTRVERQDICSGGSTLSIRSSSSSSSSLELSRSPDSMESSWTQSRRGGSGFAV